MMLASNSWPTVEEVLRVFLLQDYNTRIVVVGTAMLGCAAGIVGCFTLLRKRALIGDALSHATLPGIAVAFLAGVAFGWDEKSLLLLLVGATISGLLGVGAILVIRNMTRLKEDAALGIVLSVFFGAGVAMLSVIQQMSSGHQAGLESFIFGKTASMGKSDVELIAAVSLGCVAVCLMLYKEFKLLCFDEGFAGSRGLPVVALDVALMTTVVLICIVGLQAVGLILMIALLIQPAAAARFWTEELWKMMAIAAALGLLSGLVGAGASALFPNLPSGAMIVLACSALFLLSMVFGASRGVLWRWVRRVQLRHSVARQHLMRAMFELVKDKTRPNDQEFVSVSQVLPKRSWTRNQLSQAIERASRDELLTQIDEKLRLTKKGLIEAERLTREHRLWELYLITHAEIAPSHVDREADRIEHVLQPEVVAELEAILAGDSRDLPRSPHVLDEGGGA